MRIIVCMLVLLTALMPRANAQTASFFAMDTVMTVSLPSDDDELMEACISRVNALEGLFSVTDENSEIARLNREGKTTLSPDTRALLDFALEMCRDTDGALDITLYPIVRAWGFTTEEYRVPDDRELKELLRKVNYGALSLDENGAFLPVGMMADLGSVAKGYASDVLAQMLRDEGVESALIDLGGNIYCVGSKEDGSAWRIAVRDPMGEGYCGVLSVQNCAVVTSGCYERYFMAEDGTQYGHIIDPATGYPADNGLVSVTVVGESGALCDALSTALYVMGAEAAEEYLRVQSDVGAVLICADGSVMASTSLMEEFALLSSDAGYEIEWI